MTEEQSKIAEELQKAFAIKVPEIVSREAIIEQLELVLSNLLEKQPESFFQLMYRLDIPERKLEESLTDRELGISRVANLVYERQLQKVRSREENSTNKTADPDLEW